jgi:hypothetical protein
MFGFAIAGVIVGLVLRARRPEVYAVIGEGAEAEDVLVREEAQESRA